MVRVAFTGHRPNKLFGYDYSRPEYVRLKELIKTHLIDAITDSVNNTDEDVIEVIIGMALGLDQIAALTAIEMRNEGYHIKLVAAIPFKGQESNWPEASKKLYQTSKQNTASSIGGG